MKVYTRLDLFCAALISALGIASISGCGDSDDGGNETGQAGSGGGGATNHAGAAGTGTGGTGTGGTGTGGTGTGGTGTGGTGTGGTGTGGSNVGTGGNIAAGRPFLIGGNERLANCEARDDWRATELVVKTAELDDSVREVLALEWTRIALMEHASVAAFARFTLQLLSLGAPSELAQRAAAAMADETRHAEVCFAIASAYAQHNVGPGALSVDGCLTEMTLDEIVLTAVREGCIGETIAAIEAREASAHAGNPELRELLAQIANDEAQHAELAWRFVRWALERGPGQLLERVRAEFDAALRVSEPVSTSEPEPLDERILRSGILPESMRRSVREQALAHVVAPCARALLADSGRRRGTGSSFVALV